MLFLLARIRKRKPDSQSGIKGGDGASHPLEELALGALPTASLGICAAGNVAPDVFGDDDLGCRITPVPVGFGMVLTESDIVRSVICGGEFPFEILERIDIRGAVMGFTHEVASALRRMCGHAAGRKDGICR